MNNTLTTKGNFCATSFTNWNLKIIHNALVTVKQYNTTNKYKEYINTIIYVYYNIQQYDCL